MEQLANLLLPLLALGLLFMVINRGRRQQRAMHDVQAALAPGREVMTAAGMYGRIVEIGSDVVVLETAPGQRSRWAKQAIVKVVDEATATSSDTETSTDTQTSRDGED